MLLHFVFCVQVFLNGFSVFRGFERVADVFALRINLVFGLLCFARLRLWG